MTLQDVRRQVADDTALTYVSLAEALERRAVLAQQVGYAQQLVEISKQRGEAGFESALDQKRARRALLQIQIDQPQVESDVAALTAHLATLTGVQGAPVLVDAATIPPLETLTAALAGPGSPDFITLSAEANARAKAEQAHGDQRLLHIPQLVMQSQYGRISPFNNVSEYYNLNGNYNVTVFGVAVQLPLFDRVRAAKARETAADAAHAEHNAENVRNQQQENFVRASSSVDVLVKKVELAELDHEIAVEQLNAVVKETDTDSAAASGRQMTPTDEMFSHIDERQRYLDWLDARLQLERARISLLGERQMADWLQRVGAAGQAASCAPGAACPPAP
jgi:outer membrane protein TolC